MLKETFKGAVIASAVASMFMAGAASAQDKAKADQATTAKVQCKQDNSCGGKGACAGKDNACKGKNSCSGHVFTTKTEKECTDEGGKVVTAKK